MTDLQIETYKWLIPQVRNLQMAFLQDRDLQIVDFLLKKTRPANHDLSRPVKSLISILRKKDFLEASFQLVQVKKAVWICGSNKAPESDEFTFDHPRINLSNHASFIVLVPKVHNSPNLSEYHLINL
ncbi:hypothetical protein OSB04_005697 [Centaurea solstitialis]|uniref:Uncharacterized protein n=1 Tax=Centaurea solstitialis TaxID=347529 RepID=A0AA38WH14_9ASTR|nr:hypothetical protein OSB04_005697 [Centaurea solstitialis]